MVPLIWRSEERGWNMLFLLREEGQGLVEYGMILVLVAIAVVAVLLLLGPTIADWYRTFMDEWPSG